MVEIINNPWKSIFFVLVQFLSLGLIGLTGPIVPGSRVLVLIELVGIGLGVWAVLVMKIGKFNITPDPQPKSTLVRRGPYQLVRHPMYLALLVATFPLILNHFSLFRLLLWIILLINLVFKLNYEEGLLSEKVDGYRDYAVDSYKLIPLIY